MSKRIISSRREVLAAGASVLAASAFPFPAFAQAKPVKIGVILYLSGVQAFMGQQTRKGNEFGAKIVKEAGGPPMGFIYADAELKPENGPHRRRTPDPRRLSASDRHQRFRQHHLGRAGSGSGKDSLPNQHCFRAADYRTGIHPDIPQFSAWDCPRCQRGCAHQGTGRGDGRRTENRSSPACQ